MKNRTLVYLFISLALIQTRFSQAQEPPSGIIETPLEEVEPALLSNEIVGFRPQLGFISYEDSLARSHADLTVGVSAESNALQLFAIEGVNPNRWFAGPETGLYFSRLSYAGSVFLSMPWNLKIGYMVTDRMRVGAHGGANLTYRSTASDMRLTNNPQGPSANINLYPNLGADVDFILGGNMAISARPDLIFTSGANIFSTTLSLIFSLA